MKKSRKKMLLSSIAMLLVALVALGSATFAWYANVTRVTANTTTWNASASSGLVIRHYDDNYNGADKAAQTAWKTALSTANGNALKTATNLAPRALSFADSEGTAIAYSEIFGASATADARDSYKATSLTKVADVAGDSAYIVDQMYVAGESAAETVSMSLTGTAASATSYLNLAVYVGGTLRAVYTSSTATATRNLLAGTGTTVTESENKDYTIIPFTGESQRVGGSSFTFTANAKESNGTKVDIIAYVDGFNDNCKSDSVDIGSISVNYQFDLAS